MSYVTSPKSNEQSKEKSDRWEQLFGAKFFVNPGWAGVPHLTYNQNWGRGF